MTEHWQELETQWPGLARVSRTLSPAGGHGRRGRRQEQQLPLASLSATTCQPLCNPTCQPLCNLKVTTHLIKWHHLGQM